MAKRNASRKRGRVTPDLVLTGSQGQEELALVQAWIPASLVPRLDTLAMDEDRSRSAYLRRVILAHLEAQSLDRNKETPS